MPRPVPARLHFKTFFGIATLFINLLFLWALSGPPAAAQDSTPRLTNKDIFDMTSMGLSDEVIIAKIRSVSDSDGLKFDTSLDGL